MLTLNLNRFGVSFCPFLKLKALLYVNVSNPLYISSMKIGRRYLLVWLFLPQKGRILVSARQNNISAFFDILNDIHLN